MTELDKTGLEAAREAIARKKDEDDAPNAARLIREGKWDDTSEVQDALRGASVALEIYLSATSAGVTEEMLTIMRQHVLIEAGDDDLRGALEAARVAAPVSQNEAVAFQDRVQPWMVACFGAEISGDRVERADRLLEEVFELLQSGGYDPARVLSLRDYVWGREIGEPAQEVGGVMVTLAAYCLAHGLDMHFAGETELARIWTKVEKIRAKQAAKPTGSALPVASSPSPAPAGEPGIKVWNEEDAKDFREGVASVARQAIIDATWRESNAAVRSALFSVEVPVTNAIIAYIRSALVHPTPTPPVGVVDLIKCAEILAGLEENRCRSFPTEQDCEFARTTLAALRSPAVEGK